jgi:hypothetical protein
MTTDIKPTINKRYSYASKEKAEFLTFLYNYFHSGTDYSKTDNYFFLTLHFNYPCKSIEIALARLRPILIRVYRRLLRNNWRNRYFKSVTFIEHGKRNIFHAHTIINLRHFDKNAIMNALNYVAKRNKHTYLTCDYSESKSDKNKNYIPTRNHMLVKPQTDFDGLIDYLVKEYNFRSFNLDASNFASAEMLFDLKFKENDDLPHKQIINEIPMPFKPLNINKLINRPYQDIFYYSRPEQIIIECLDKTRLSINAIDHSAISNHLENLVNYKPDDNLYFISLKLPVIDDAYVSDETDDSDIAGDTFNRILTLIYKKLYGDGWDGQMTDNCVIKLSAPNTRYYHVLLNAKHYSAEGMKRSLSGLISKDDNWEYEKLKIRFSQDFKKLEAAKSEFKEMNAHRAWKNRIYVEQVINLNDIVKFVIDKYGFVSWRNNYNPDEYSKTYLFRPMTKDEAAKEPKPKPFTAEDLL